MSAPVHQLQPSLAEAELAIVTALRAHAVLAATVQGWNRWEGELSDAMEVGAPMKLPAILVGFQGGDLTATGVEEGQLLADWWVVVLNRSVRGRDQARTPTSTGRVGSYDLVQAVIGALVGSDLDLDGLGELRLVGVDPLAVDRTEDELLSAFLVRLQATVDLVAVEPDTYLETLQATLGPPLAEDVVEATITLETP